MDKQEEQAFAISAQYIKDFSFENITPAHNITTANEQPKIDVELKVEIEKDAPNNVHTVHLITNIKTQVKDKTLFVLDLDYAGEFLIKGIEKTILEQLLYIECPRVLFPYVRCVISNAVSEGGFPPLYLAPVDFVSLYQQHLEAQKQPKQ